MLIDGSVVGYLKYAKNS